MSVIQGKLKGASPEPSETQAGGMGGIRSNQHKGTQSGVSETKPEQGSVSDVAGEPTKRSGAAWIQAWDHLEKTIKGLKQTT